MTIETYIAGSGDTYILIHPAGLSYYDQTPESVAKFNSSDSFVVGDLLCVNVNTSSGELWSKVVTGSESSYIGLRQGIATVASGSGAGSVTIKRIPRQILYAAGGTESAFALSSPGNGNGGDSTNSGRESLFNNTLFSSPLPLATLLSAIKPTSEIWNLGQTAYGYTSAGVDLSTNNSATANAQTICWIMGEICAKAIVGTTSSYVLQSCAYDASIAQSVPLAKTSSAKVINGTLSGSELNLGGSLYSSPDGFTVSATATSTCSVLRGTCVGIDKSASVHVYYYFDTYGMYSSGSAEAVNASMGGTDLFFITPYPINGKNGTTRNGYNIIASVANSGGFRTHLCAPILLSKGSPAFPDLAYDPILPSPFTALRVIWTYTPGPVVNTYAHYPVIAKKTVRTIAPYPGMIAALRDKPERNTTLSYNAGLITSSGLYPLLPESRATPYTWNNYQYITGVYLASIVRGCMFPQGKFIFNGAISSDYKWRWEKFDFASGAWVAITSFVVGSGTNAGDVDITPPTGLPDEEVYMVKIQMEFVSGGSPTTTPFASDYANTGAWPFDVVKAFNDNDSGGAWAGNAGWVWPNAPALPTVAWGNEPVFSLVGNTLTMTTTTPTRTVTADSKFSNTAVLGYASGLGAGAPALSISYDDGDSVSIPDLSAVNVGASKAGLTPYATRLRSGGGSWSWGNSLSLNIYPSQSGSKNIKVRLYYTAIIASAYTSPDIGYASPRVVSQSFTLQ